MGPLDLLVLPWTLVHGLWARATLGPMLRDLDPRRIRIVQDAIDRVGTPYRLGAEARVSDDAPREFDCSELVEWVYRRAGISMPDGATAQYHATQRIDPGPDLINLRPGDLMFWYNVQNPKIPDRPVEHVAIYIGDGRLVEAAKSKGAVAITSVRDRAVSRSGRFRFEWGRHPDLPA